MTLLFDWPFTGSLRETVLDTAPTVQAGTPLFAKTFLGEMLNRLDIADELRIAHNAAYNVGSADFTITMLIKVGTQPAARFFRKRASTVAGWVVNLAGSDQIRTVINDGTNEVATNYNTIVTDNEFHFVVVVVDRGADLITVYIDDVAEATTPDISSVTGSLDNTEPVRTNQGATTGVIGLAGRYRIYNTALSAAERTQLFKNATKFRWGYAVMDGDDNP